MQSTAKEIHPLRITVVLEGFGIMLGKQSLAWIVWTMIYRVITRDVGRSDAHILNQVFSVH